MLLQGAIGMGMALFGFLGLSIVIFVPVCSVLWYQFLKKKILHNINTPQLFQHIFLLLISLIFAVILVVGFDFIVIYLLDLWIEADGGYDN